MVHTDTPPATHPLTDEARELLAAADAVTALEWPGMPAPLGLALGDLLRKVDAFAAACGVTTP